MNRWLMVATVIVVLALFGSLSSSAAAKSTKAKVAFTAATSVDADGWGPFRIGETVRAAEKRLGRSLTPVNYDAFDGLCWNLVPFKSGGASIMVEADKKGDPKDGIVVRIESTITDTTKPIFIGRLRVGATAKEIKKAFPAAVQSKHEYTDGFYLDIKIKKNRYVRFEIGDGVTSDNVFMGTQNATRLVEGCA
jgi:hypothetical protein